MEGSLGSAAGLHWGDIGIAFFFDIQFPVARLVFVFDCWSAVGAFHSRVQVFDGKTKPN